MKTARQRYLDKRTIAGPWQITGIKRADYNGAVIIPACDEEQWLFRTLDSLAANPPEQLADFLVLVVVNHPPGADHRVKIANRRTLEYFTASPLRHRLQLGWIDACCQGLEMVDGGVGAARKLGFDLALARLRDDIDPILVSLDADTLVEPNYLETIARHFATHRAGGAVLPFVHQPAEDVVGQQAIVHYELYMRCYLQGLRQAGSPYAFHALGSALACRASAYVNCGGMNRRPGGEDFYFLQSLVKTGGVDNLFGTTVHPAARLSTRVPFGTGPALRQLLDDPGKQSFYPPEAFALIRDWLALVENSTDRDGAGLQKAADALSPELGQLMHRRRLATTWDRLRNNHAGEVGRMRAFHAWFDGLKTRQLLRGLCRTGRCKMLTATEAIPRFLAQLGLAGTGSLADDLELFRSAQNTAPPVGK